MIKLLIEYQVRGFMPVYKIVKQTFLAETMIYPQWRDPATKQITVHRRFGYADYRDRLS